MHSKKHKESLTKNTIKKIISESQQRLIPSGEMTPLSKTSEENPKIFSPFNHERDQIGRLLTQKSPDPYKLISTSKVAPEIKSILRKREDIRRKREKIRRTENDFFSFSSNFYEKTMNLEGHFLQQQEKSEYFQNSLKNILEYDEENWQKRNILPKNWQKSNKEKKFSLDFKQLVKKTPETLTSNSFKKRKVTNLALNSEPKFYPEKTPPLGLYDVDHCKFAMQRTPKCLINKDYVSSHDYYYDKITKLKNEEENKLKLQLKVPLSNRTEPEQERNLDSNVENQSRSNPRKLKELEIKKRDDLSVKVLKDYDLNFWNKFLGGIKTMKDHIKKIRHISNNLGYGDSLRLIQILKTNTL